MIPLEQKTEKQIAQSSQTSIAASKLVLLSSLINNINTATVKKDDIYVIASTIGLTASYLSQIAALQEAMEQQIAPGITTFANELKIISSSLGFLSGVIAYWALLIEVSLRAQGIQAPQTSVTTGNTTVTGSLLV